MWLAHLATALNAFSAAWTGALVLSKCFNALAASLHAFPLPFFPSKIFKANLPVFLAVLPLGHLVFFCELDFSTRDREHDTY